jgi:hypothetical protein
MTQWLARLVGLPIGTPGYEEDLARWLGPDLFGLRDLPRHRRSWRAPMLGC